MFVLDDDKKKFEAIDKRAEIYYDRYRQYIDSLSKYTILGRTKGISTWDIVQVGEMLDKWTMLEHRINEEGISNLNPIPKVAYDVIALAYGSSVIPFIASVQNIEEERGTVYFKVIKRADTGAVIASAKTGVVHPQGFASNYYSETLGTTSAGTTTYNVSISNTPVRPEIVKITVGDSYGQDDGNGNILGVGLHGTIDYSTGDVTINLYSDPGDGVNIVATYQVDVEATDDIATIDYSLDSVGVTAKIYALKGLVGMLQSFALKNRFGVVAEDELAKDLVVAINNEVGGDIIRELNSDVPVANAVDWNKTPDSGISYTDHKLTLKDKIAEVEGLISASAGRGIISTIVCGTNAASIISTLPGFTKVSSGKEMGSHVYGELDGMVVVRVNDSTTLDANIILGVYNPDSPFEGAAVYAPYMPLITTDMLPAGKNPLVNQKAAAVWAAVDVLVPEFVGKITVTES